jgi:hypothetical protein
VGRGDLTGLAYWLWILHFSFKNLALRLEFSAGGRIRDRILSVQPARREPIEPALFPRSIAGKQGQASMKDGGLDAGQSKAARKPSIVLSRTRTCAHPVSRLEFLHAAESSRSCSVSLSHRSRRRWLHARNCGRAAATSLGVDARSVGLLSERGC